MEQVWIWQRADWPRFRWDAEALQPLVVGAMAERQLLLDQLQSLDTALSMEALAALLSRESIGTAAIEGQQLDPADVRSSVARRLQMPLERSSVRSSAQVEGLVQVLFTAVEDPQRPLTLETLHQWHRDLFAAQIGVLRGSLPMQVVSGPMGRERLHFEAPPRDGLEQELAAFLAWFNQPSQLMNGLLRAGLAHLWFLTLHPYDDGNGRLARAVTDRALAQLPWPSANRVDALLLSRALGLSARFQQQRQAYYNALESSQRGDLEVTAWLIWFLEQVQASAARHREVVATVQAKALFWWRHRHSGFNQRQQKLLNRLLDAEPDGFEGGMTLRKAISLTGVSRATAWRDLSDLVAIGALVPLGEGRSRAYQLGLS